nr:unnamed protein product [Callosobruchus chinensis]
MRLTCLYGFILGIKEIGFPDAEPVKAPSPFTLNLNGNKNLEYSITYTNTYFSGCTYLTIPEIKTELGDDSDRCGWTIDMRLPKVVLYGDYSVIGKMLMIQLNGHGKFNLTVSNLTMLSIGKCEKYQRSGKTYIKLTNYTVDVNPENVVYYFENLVPGNPEVSAQVIKTLNDDPLLVWNDVKSGLNAVVARLKEISFPEVDPVKAPTPSIINANGGQMQLTMKLTNCYLRGATTNSKIVDMKIDMDNGCRWALDVEIPVLEWYGDYAIQGKLLMFQLNGHGKCNFTLLDTKIHQEMRCQKYQKNDKTHIKITNYTMDINPKTMIYDMQNIIPGNPEISEQVVKTLNADPLLVWAEIKPAFETIVAQMHKDVGNKLYSKIPFDEIYLP